MAHHSVHSTTPLIPLLRQMNQDPHHLIPFKIHFNVMLLSPHRPAKSTVFRLIFLMKASYALSFFLMHATCPAISSPLCCVRSTNYEALYYVVFHHLPFSSSLLNLTVFLSRAFSDTLPVFLA